jgi:proteasome lid subunit RPN8/RPN11
LGRDVRGVRKAVIRREDAELLLAMAREVHPNEVIALLHGERKGNSITINEISLPPMSTYGEGYSSFNPYALPIDLTIVGIAHSHPSGVGRPSLEDLNNFIGYIMVILTYPYSRYADIHVFDGESKRVMLEVV